MLTYWIMFSLPLFGVLAFENNKPWLKHLLLFFITLFFILVVGFRFEVGCDWEAYEEYFYRAEIVSEFNELGFISSDYGYALINFFAVSQNGSVVWVNFLCAIVSLTGLFFFARKQPLPFLAYLIAVPYIVIVLFQGYTRQATAFGFELLALAALSQAQNLRFAFFILTASFFHKTALVLLPLAALAKSTNRWWSYFWVGFTTLAAFYFFLADEQQRLWEAYVENSMESSGGGIRVAMNVLPAMLFLLFSKRFTFQVEEEEKLWRWFSILSLLCVPLVFQSSTAVDRLALYLMPIQLYVFTRLPDAFPERRKLVIAGIVILYFSVQFVWLNFATHAMCWVPYQSELF